MIMRAPLSTLALEDGTLRASELTLRPHFQLMSCSWGGEEESGDIRLCFNVPPFDRHCVGGVTSANANAFLFSAAARRRFTFHRVGWLYCPA